MKAPEFEVTGSYTEKGSKVLRALRLKRRWGEGKTISQFCSSVVGAARILVAKT